MKLNDAPKTTVREKTRLPSKPNTTSRSAGIPKSLSNYSTPGSLSFSQVIEDGLCEFGDEFTWGLIYVIDIKAKSKYTLNTN